MEHKEIFFSVIIPTYGRPKPLGICLQSLVRQNYPRDGFEVIIVDDGSETPPETIIASFHNLLDIRLITQAHAGPATARNTGAAHARGRFLAFTDDDCSPSPDWLKKLNVCLYNMPHSAIGGKTINALPDNPYATAKQMLTSYLYTYYNADPAQARFLASNNLALPAYRFRSVGGFDTSFPRAGGEDREFCARWLSHGHRIVYAPEAQVFHAHGFTFRTFWRQHFNYGRGAFHFHQMCSQRSHKHKHREPSGFYANLLCYPFYRSFAHPTSLIALLFMMTQIANTAGYFWERMKQRAKNSAESS